MVKISCSGFRGRSKTKILANQRIEPICIGRRGGLGVHQLLIKAIVSLFRTLLIQLVFYSFSGPV